MQKAPAGTFCITSLISKYLLLEITCKIDQWQSTVDGGALEAFYPRYDLSGQG